MRIPSNLTSLVDEGLLEEVVRPLLSGKEAEVFLVRSGGVLRVAKVYKEAQNRTFKNRAEYTEGRKVRNSRDQRAMDKRTRHGRAQDEAAWRSTEVDMIYRLRDAGVRVPAPHNFIDGVLVMEMVSDAEGHPAPRLAEVSLDRDQAKWVFDRLLAEVVRMLCADIVHGDLSDFNVLMSADGPVIIDFPQSVDASKNQNAKKLLLRDVANLDRFLARFVPEQRPRAFGEEMWDLYTQSLLTPETKLTGRHRASERRVDTRAVLELIGDANYDELKRRERHGLGKRGVPAVPAGYDAGGQGQRPPPPAATGGGQRPPPQHTEHRPPQHAGGGGGQRPPQHTEHRPPQHTGYRAPQHHEQRPPQQGHRPPQQGEQRPPQHTDQRPPQHSEQRPAQYNEQRPPRHAGNGGGQRPPQHTEQRPPQHAGNGGGQRPPQYNEQRPPRHAGNGGGQRPPQHSEQRPPQQAGHRPPPAATEPRRQHEEAPAAAPRRRVIVSVSTEQRRPRRTP
jgi:RIO kinase 1